MNAQYSLDIRVYFNIITSLEDKNSGWHRMEEDCETFRDTIEELGRVDIIPVDGWFTWKNKGWGRYPLLIDLTYSWSLNLLLILEVKFTQPHS